jgi:hypothetical protein
MLRFVLDNQVALNSFPVHITTAGVFIRVYVWFLPGLYVVGAQIASAQLVQPSNI